MLHGPNQRGFRASRIDNQLLMGKSVSQLGTNQLRTLPDRRWREQMYDFPSPTQKNQILKNPKVLLNLRVKYERTGLDVFAAIESHHLIHLFGDYVTLTVV